MYSNRNFDREASEELRRLKEIEDRLEMAIKTHEVYLEDMKAAPKGDLFLTKKVALEFTLDILRDIRNGDS